MDANYRKHLYDYQLQAPHYRGTIIDTFNLLEKVIEDYIIQYFQPKDELDLRSIILYQLSFDSKAKALHGILAKQATEKGFVKTDNNKWPHGSLNKRIEEVKNERNKFAHYYLLNPKEVTDDVIILAEYKNGFNTIAYRKSKFDDLINEIRLLTVEVAKMVGYVI